MMLVVSEVVEVFKLVGLFVTTVDFLAEVVDFFVAIFEFFVVVVDLVVLSVGLFILVVALLVEVPGRLVRGFLVVCLDVIDFSFCGERDIFVVKIGTVVGPNVGAKRMIILCTALL